MPKISVCMAVYNGYSYVNQQIVSILNQLSFDDELVIIDDCSYDGTFDLIKNIKDFRIRLYKNKCNLGVIKTFERAIRESSGDIIFLSDQDDIWYPSKVAKIMYVFNTMENITMVATDATVIDGDGKIEQNSFISKRGKFRSNIISTIFKNKYLGCTLSFRRTLINKLLPIPKDVPMHDIWFGSLNYLFGKVYFINEPLIYYRRHNNNVSPIKSVNFCKQLFWRFLLIKNLLIRCLVLFKNYLF